MLTQKDLDKIEKLLDEKIEEKIKYLPTKDDFYTKMDELMGEVKAMREEQTIIVGKISEHSDSLEDHEKRISYLKEASQVK